jgi:hypothetical protein
MNTLKTIDEAIKALDIALQAHKVVFELAEAFENLNHTLEIARERIEMTKQALTNLKALRDKLGGEELVEEVAKTLRLDLTDRRGIKQAIYECDEEIQKEIFYVNAKAAIKAMGV